jgi:hypothetical protein
VLVLSCKYKNDVVVFLFLLSLLKKLCVEVIRAKPMITYLLVFRGKRTKINIGERIFTFYILETNKKSKNNDFISVQK